MSANYCPLQKEQFNDGCVNTFNFLPLLAACTDANCEECSGGVGMCTKCNLGHFLDNNECRGKAETLFVQEPASIKVRSHCCATATERT